jgi:Zn-dependent peptidase ImmA (M78 family)
LNLKEARGICLVDDEFPVIVVSSKDSAYGKIFSLIHELCHLILKTSDIFSEQGVQKYDSYAKSIEVYCNKFTANFLVPRDAFDREIPKTTPISFENVRQISEKFRVSTEVILRRLADLKYISVDEYQKYRDKWKDYEPKKLKSKGGPSYSVKTVSQLGINYISTLLRPYYEGRIGIDSLSEHLGVKINNIPKIESTVYKYLGKAA